MIRFDDRVAIVTGRAQDWGRATCCHAVWPIMRVQQYGRIVLALSGSGPYGAFGQSNHGAAKAAMVGLMNVLHLEGARDNIAVNMLAPTAATQMPENLLPEAALALLQPETSISGLLYLVSDDGPGRTIPSAGRQHLCPDPHL
jgi:NAD(P)-dependent dehydrogenase (short-subunit alcohol dehydrogenase family)